MKNNASVVVLLLLVCFFILIRPFTVLSSINSSPSIFNKTHLIEGNTYTSIWINLIQLNNLLFLLIMLVSMVLLVMAFRKWNNIKFYDVSIIKKLDIVAHMFIAEGVIIALLYFTTINKEFSKEPIFNVLKMDLEHGLLLLLIGLLFALITAILTNAKLVKDENDLTI